MAGEGAFAPVLKGLFPVTDEIGVEAEAACGFGSGVALIPSAGP
jgi:hypothetical protein